MSALTVTADRDFSSTTTISVHPESVMQRVRRALVMSGMTALIIGAVLGLIQADPLILIARFGYLPHPLLVALVGGGVIGLVSGLIAGLALRGKMGLLRWMVAMFAVVVGVIVSEIVYGFGLGMSLGEALRAAGAEVEAVEFGMGAAMSLIGSLAGWQKVRRNHPVSAGTGAIVAPPAATPVVGWRRLRSQTATSSASSSGASSRPASGSARSAHRSRRTSRASHKRSTPQVEITAPSAAVKPATRSRRGLLSRRRRQVHLGRQSTNVCPYCLEEVLPNDPRGKVVCEICGTPHHGDCWAITGKCEVPHLQT